MLTIAPPTVQQARDGVLHRGHVTPQVHRHDAVPYFEVDVNDVGVGMDDPHVGAYGEDGVDAAVDGGGGLEQRGDGVGLCQIESDGTGGTAVRDDVVGSAASGIDSEVTYHDQAAFIGEPGGGRRTDAGRATGHDDNFSDQTTQSRPPCCAVGPRRSSHQVSFSTQQFALCTDRPK